MCRAEEAAGSKPTTLSALISAEEISQQNEEGRRNQDQLHEVASDGLTDQPLMAVHVSPTPKLFRALLSISGMTCSSCVGKITEALRSKTWIQSVDVNLLTNSASVDFYGREHLGDIITAIKVIGYEATVDENEELQDFRSPSLLSTDDTWRATYAIAGMTCSSCVGSITGALKMLDWVVKVEVNLISNSATVV